MQHDGSLRLRICWGLVLAWLLVTAASLALGNPMIGALSALMLPAIMLVHGSILFGWKGIGTYVVIGIAVGFSLEASSVANGFPFGSYVHNVPGPKPMGVPIQAITAYMLIGWFAMMIARIIALDVPWLAQPLSRVTVPLIAAFVIAGLDLPYDPIGATVQGDWTFAYPSGQFGVPLTNFLGWMFTGWVLFQIFVFIEGRFPPAPAAKDRRFWLVPVLFWLGMAMKFPVDWMRAAPGTVSVGERTFVIADIYEAAVITSLFTLVGVAVIAGARILSRSGGWPRD